MIVRSVCRRPIIIPNRAIESTSRGMRQWGARIHTLQGSGRIPPPVRWRDSRRSRRVRESFSPVPRRWRGIETRKKGRTRSRAHPANRYLLVRPGGLFDGLADQWPKHACCERIEIAVSSDSLFFKTFCASCDQTAIRFKLMARVMAWRRPITPSLRALLLR